MGSTNRRADGALIEELRRHTRNESFDEQPVLELGSEAIDFRAASESFADLRRLTRKDLAYWEGYGTQSPSELAAESASG